MIQAYLDQLKRVIDSYAAAPFVLEVQMNFESRPGGQAYVVGSRLFQDRSTLHFREYLDATENQVNKLTYSYHYQDADDRLIFRYDNARHRTASPALEHKHTEDAVTAKPAPTLPIVLTEIIAMRQWV